MVVTKFSFYLLILLVYRQYLNAAMTKPKPDTYDDILGSIVPNEFIEKISTPAQEQNIPSGTIVLVPKRSQSKEYPNNTGFLVVAIPHPAKHWMCAKVIGKALNIHSLQVGLILHQSNTSAPAPALPNIPELFIHTENIYYLCAGAFDKNPYFALQEMRIPALQLLQYIKLHPQTATPLPPECDIARHTATPTYNTAAAPSQTKQPSQVKESEQDPWDIATLIDIFRLGMKIATVAAVIGCISRRCK